MIFFVYDGFYCRGKNNFDCVYGVKEKFISGCWKMLVFIIILLKLWVEGSFLENLFVRF